MRCRSELAEHSAQAECLTVTSVVASAVDHFVQQLVEEVARVHVERLEEEVVHVPVVALVEEAEVVEPAAGSYLAQPYLVVVLPSVPSVLVSLVEPEEVLSLAEPLVDEPVGDRDWPSHVVVAVLLAMVRVVALD